MDASIWVMFISNNSDTLEIAEHILFNLPTIIRRCGFHFRSTDLADKPRFWVNLETNMDEVVLRMLWAELKCENGLIVFQF